MILNLATVIPVAGDVIITALLGGSTLGDLGLRRFVSLHFVTAVFATAVALLHVVLVHKSHPSGTQSLTTDGILDLSTVVVTDIAYVVVVLLPLCGMFLMSLIPSDN